MALGWGIGLLDHSEEAHGRESAHIPHRLRDGGEGNPAEGGKTDIIVAYDRHLLRNGHSELKQAGHDAYGHVVVEHEDSAGAGVQGISGRREGEFESLLISPDVRVMDVVAHACIEGLRESLETIGNGLVVVAAHQDGLLPLRRGVDVFRDESAAFAVVRRDVGDSWIVRDAVHDHERQAGILERGDRSGLGSDWGDEYPVDAVRDKGLDERSSRSGIHLELESWIV